jgi:septum formation protein
LAQKIILASGSTHRRMLLENAGLEFRTEKPEIDERAVEAALAGSGAAPEDVAAVLAEAKAVAVSERHPEALVIGSDQTLLLGDELLHQPADMEAARRQLLRLSGRTHQLSSAVVLAGQGTALWRHASVAYMTMRKLDPAYVGRYLSKVGEAALSSVGCYQIEGKGIRLFERIEGDFFTIVGLPLLPLLAALRERGVIDG